MAGFFVMTTILVGLFWFGNNFLIQKDDFLDIIPVDTTIYWHFSGSDEQKKEWFFLKTKEILKEAVLLGGDTDSTASIALGINAIKYGLEDLPEFLMQDLTNHKYGREYLIELGNNLEEKLFSHI